MGTNTAIEKYITEELLNGKGVDRIKPDDSLIDAGILDSFDLVRLISFIEENYHVDIRDDEVMPDNFHSVNAINAFIESKT